MPDDEATPASDRDGTVSGTDELWSGSTAVIVTRRVKEPGEPRERVFAFAGALALRLRHAAVPSYITDPHASVDLRNIRSLISSHPGPWVFSAWFHASLCLSGR